MRPKDAMVAFAMASIVMGIEITTLFNMAAGTAVLIIALVVVSVLIYYGYDDPSKKFPWQS